MDNLLKQVNMERLAHANGFVFLVFAYCTRKVYLDDEVCRDV
jgi:hypothetical protein